MNYQDNTVVQLRAAILVAAEHAEAAIKTDSSDSATAWANITLTLASALEKVPR